MSQVDHGHTEYYILTLLYNPKQGQDNNDRVESHQCYPCRQREVNRANEPGFASHYRFNSVQRESQ